MLALIVSLYNSALKTVKLFSRLYSLWLSVIWPEYFGFIDGFNGHHSHCGTRLALSANPQRDNPSL